MNKLFQDVVDSIPDYKAFLTVDEMDASTLELAKLFPQHVSVREVGKTRGGHGLLCMTISCGDENAPNALMLGCPHPNEPIGVMMLEHMTRALAENEALRKQLGYNWHIVKAWDADGLRLNEGWLKGPFTLTNYFRNFFRPAGYEQVDWTFPISYKKLNVNNPIPETKAAMELIDELKPKFIYTLHNAGFGGTYWYMTKPLPRLFDTLKGIAVSFSVPPHLGEPESAASEVYAPAFYSNLGIRSAYDYAEALGRDMDEYAASHRSGDCSASYALQRWDSFTLLTELPYFYDPRIADQSDSGMTRLEASIQRWDENDASTAEVRAIIDPVSDKISPDCPFLKAVINFTTSNGNVALTRQKAAGDPEYQRNATVAEHFDNLLVSRFYKALTYGMALRSLEGAVATNPGDAPLLKARDDMSAAFDRKAGWLEAQMNYSVVPIRNLVAIQLASGLLVAEALNS